MIRLLRDAMRLLAAAVLLTPVACHPAAQPAPAADALPQCAGPQPMYSRSYYVFFGQHSAAVNDRGVQVIRDFVNSLSNHEGVTVVIVTNEDTSEVLPRDRNLGLRRGRAIAHLMQEDGVSATNSIRVIAAGTKDPLVPTPPLTAEPQNRHALLAAEGGKQLRPTARQADCMDWLRTHRCDPPVSAAQDEVCLRVRKVAQEFRS